MTGKTAAGLRPVRPVDQAVRWQQFQQAHPDVTTRHSQEDHHYVGVVPVDGQDVEVTNRDLREFLDALETIVMTRQPGS